MSGQWIALTAAILVLATAAALVWLLGRSADARRAGRFSERPAVGAAGLWEAFYRENGVYLDSVESALRLISQATTVPEEKLRPGDRFAIELAPERGWECDDGLAEVAWYMESKSKGSSRGIKTVDDLIRVLDHIKHPS